MAVPFFIKRYLFYKEKFYKKSLYKRMSHKKKYNICGRLCNRRQRVKEWNPEEFPREQVARKQKDKKERKERKEGKAEEEQWEEEEAENRAPTSVTFSLKDTEPAEIVLNPLRRESLSEEERLYQRCKERSLYLLTGAAKTERRLREKLQKSEHYTEEIIERTLAFLKEYDYINDYRYCMQYLEENAHRRSAKDMQSKLYGRGVDGTVIREALEDFQRKHREEGVENSFEEQEETNPERIALRRWLEKKSRNMDLSDWKERQKLTASLLRKGFSYSMIQEYLQEE